MVLLWDQPKDPLGEGNFNPMWHGPYIIKHVLENGAYELVDYEGTTLAKPINGLYLKKYYHDSQPRLVIVYYCTFFHS